MKHYFADGTVVKPLKQLATRLFGFGATVAAVPYATQKAFQAIYDVTDEERGYQKICS